LSGTVAAYTFDQLVPGQEAAFEHTITEAEIDAFAALSGDVSPLHISDEFAHNLGFPGRVAHGGLMTALVSRLFGVYLPGRFCLVHSLAMTYLVPVHAGDRLVLCARIKQISEAVRSFSADVGVIRLADDVLVARGKAQIGFTA
jgi:3-hydroxybutyryl-CoA dehydratase